MSIVYQKLSWHLRLSVSFYPLSSITDFSHCCIIVHLTSVNNNAEYVLMSCILRVREGRIMRCVIHIILQIWVLCLPPWVNYSSFSYQFESSWLCILYYHWLTQQSEALGLLVCILLKTLQLFGGIAAVYFAVCCCLLGQIHGTLVFIMDFLIPCLQACIFCVAKCIWLIAGL